MRTHFVVLVPVALLLGLFGSVSGCDCRSDEESAVSSAALEPPVDPIEIVEVDMDKVYLGRRLFHDPILSGDGTVSCATCHSLDHAGAEDRRTSTGINDQVGPINSPTVLNAHYNFRQFWDGRAATLEEQAAGPVENPIEMGATFTQVIPRISEDEWYAERFAAIYGAEDAVSTDNITNAIAEYERYLVTPSPFDAYLRGDQSALTAEQQAGWQTFQDVGCTTCHQGPNLGGSMYQKMGLIQDYFDMRGGEITEADLGRFNVTQDVADRHFFKVPTLRNISQTAPYFHDGSQAALADAVRVMGQVQLAQPLDDAQITSIVAFLQSLDGALPDEARLPDNEIPPDRRVSDEETAVEQTAPIGAPG